MRKARRQFRQTVWDTSQSPPRNLRKTQIDETPEQGKQKEIWVTTQPSTPLQGCPALSSRKCFQTDRGSIVDREIGLGGPGQKFFKKRC